ncbi:LacI family transcriptional regulator [Terracoccus luteus]|uniref:LacI family transcriptional regulator n=1 Tax=Terracoccus luteus TaxID=53356 RepID=A0A495Y4L6_9MICO|nr:LacI family DNA-binding transcriptional regulator [Terracoccus luteus]RKT79558.1 LacI family transcriptional regulator [Terracoccus luteus]
MAQIRRPTISDVARAAGVSKGAVSFAINGRDGVSAETRSRILRAADELGFTRDVRARGLSSSRAMAVALVIARPPETLGADPFFAVFVAGVETVLSQAGFALVMQVVPTHVSEEEAYERLAGEGRADGVFLTDLRVDDDRPAVLRRLGLPGVRIAPDIDDSAPSVVVDDRPGIRAAVEHLVALGHTRLAHVGGPATYVHGASRRAAFDEATDAAGLAPGLHVEADFSAEGGAAATAKLLDLPPRRRPTAVVYANDLMAAAGIAVAADRGLDVPGDLSVTGFDDTAVSAVLRPGLTTVHTDVLAWGAAAAQTLLAAIDAGIDATDDVHLPPPHLVVRGSTAEATRPTGIPQRERR